MEKNGFSADVEDLVEVEPPKQAEHGDFATNFCLVASKKLGQNPRVLAEMLVEAIREADQNQLVTEIDIAGPGFINFKLSATQVAAHIGTVLEKAEDFGRLENDSPERINVEFVSVNPNGPITIGSGRGAALGSALCNVLEAAGNEVHREYYINDGVNSEQMRLFAESVKAIIEGRPVPDNGYKGDYVYDVAQSIKSSSGNNQSNFAPVHFEPDAIAPMPFFEIPRFLHESGQTLAIITVDGATAKVSIEGDVRAEMPAEIAHKFVCSCENQCPPKTHRFAASYNGQTMYVDSASYAVESTFSISSVLPGHSLDLYRVASQDLMVDRQRSNLSAFQTNFDTWFSEQSLHDSGEVEKELDHLIKSNVADDGPYRIKLDMAKGGMIKDVIREEQPVDEDDAEDSLPEDRGGIEGGVENSSPSKTVWLRSTKFGDDQDRVLRRKDGRLTYIASDVAYHKDKFSRPADATKLITVLGPDHHGYIGRLTAVVAAMHADQAEPINNSEPLSEIEAKLYSSVEERNRCQASLAWAKEHLEVQIFQIVRFLKDGKPAPMRKRDGNIYALIDLVNEIGETIRPNGTEAEKQQAGSDVARFFYLMRHHDTAMDFDLELATKQSDENPVFYVQYAHARISSVIEKAKEQGFTLPPLRANGEGERGGEVTGALNFNHGLLNHPKEIALILKICDLPHEVERTAKDYSVNRLTTYAIELARTYHSFYDSCRVIQSDQPELTLARLAMCQATRIALKNALNLLGVSAPERMDRTVTN
ncbi:MAG: arginine--tRNA ligase [Fimbriimonadaceae bacterium]|nr:MAG: arginine--tRNA ligase [Fimbriimonadaceae bacterium]